MTGPTKTYGIIGAGRLGRALAVTIARAGASVVLETRDQARTLATTASRTLIDCTNPEAEHETALVVGCKTSGAEIIAQRTGRPVAKAFNHLYAELLLKGPQFGDTRGQGFFCGDDANARRDAKELLERLDYEAVDAGPLRSARFLEPLALLMVELVRGRNRPAADIAFRIATRE